MNEQKPEYLVLMDDNEHDAQRRLNKAAAEGYELAAQSSALYAQPGEASVIWTTWTLRLRPQLHLTFADTSATVHHDDRPTLDDRVAAVVAVVECLRDEHDKLVADVLDLEERLKADQADHAQHHTMWDNSIQHRLNALGKVANELTARTEISSQLCVACAGTGRQVVGKSDQGPITAGCPTCDGTGRVQP